MGTGNAASNDTETKLREALRNTMLQLRSAQNERATLQAAQAESEQKVKTLTAQVDSLTKRATAAEKTSADQQAQLSKFKEAIQNWETAYKQAIEVGNRKEEARAKLAREAISLQRQVVDQQSRNAAMFRTANEILTRYERFGLGEALAAKEPFVGITRVKLENLVQDYQDKLLDARIKETDNGAVAKQAMTSNHQENPSSQSGPSSRDRKSPP
jgi:chromosome segregation ATPase